MIDRKWYQFKLIINRQIPSETTVIFPLNPEDYPPAGIQIHKYLLQQGLFKQRTGARREASPLGDSDERVFGGKLPKSAFGKEASFPKRDVSEKPPSVSVEAGKSDLDGLHQKELAQESDPSKTRRAGGFYYVADSNEVNLDNLESLYYKFKEQGASIERVESMSVEYIYITKEEFERFKAETKKSLITIEQELQSLEKDVT